MNAPTSLQLGLIDSLRDRPIWCGFDELKQPFGLDKVIGIKSDAPRKRLGTYEQAKALNMPYVGISFTQPIYIDEKLLVCIDLDWKRSYDLKPDNTQVALMESLTNQGVAYETSHSTNGAHYWTLIDEDNLPSRLALADKREIEIFSGLPGQRANVLVTDYDSEGSLICADLAHHLPKYKKPSLAIRKQAPKGSQTESDRIELLKAVQHIPCTDYWVWLRVGMALKYELGDLGFKPWDAWSSNDARYDAQEIIYKWNSFNGNGVSAGTIFHYAKEYGYKFPKKNTFELVDLDTGEIPSNDEITTFEVTNEIVLAPYPGVMADTVERGLAAAFKPQPNLLMLSALIGMAAGCSGKYRFADNTRLNLYGTGIAGTGWGKDSPRQVAISLAKAAGAKIIGKAASGEGLEDNLEDFRGMLSEVDEIAHLFEALNGVNKAPYLATMALAFLALFSASAGIYHTRVRAKTKDNEGPRSIQNPCFSLLGFATPEKLGKALNQGNAEDGLMGRILFVNGVDAPPSRHAQEFILPPSAVAYANAIKANTNFNSDTTIININPSADDLLWELTQKYDEDRKRSSSPIETQVLIRSAEKLKRIAGVLAVWENPATPEIELAHLQWSEKFIDLSNRSLLQFLDKYLASEEQISDANALKEIFQKILLNQYKPGNANEIAILNARLIPHSQALRLFRRPTARLEKAVQYLYEIGEVMVCKIPDQVRVTRGCPPKVYKLL